MIFTQKEFVPYEIAQYIAVPNSLLADYTELGDVIAVSFHVTTYGHHVEDGQCCCNRKFATLRGTLQHARYQNRKHRGPLFTESHLGG